MLPTLGLRFPVSKVEEIIKEVLVEVLEDQTYQAELTHQWTKLISDTVKSNVKELDLPRYKIMVRALRFALNRCSRACRCKP